MEGQDRQAVGAGALTPDADAPIQADALIIGAGPVGLFQAFQLGLLEISSHIVDALPHAGGQCVELYGDKPIYDIPGVPATTGRGLVASLRQQLAPFKPQFHLGQQIATLAPRDDGQWAVGTTRGAQFVARTVFIAAGVGAFVPRRLTLAGIEALEGQSLFYHPESLDRFRGQAVVVNGGDDAAIDTAMALVDIAAHVTLLHRRDVFQVDDERKVSAMREQAAADRLTLLIGQPTAFDGGRLTVAVSDGSTATPTIDALIVCNGISPRLGPIADWGLALERKQIPVDTEKFETQLPGVYAVGDINTYPGKRKLILCGFHEATLAAWGATARVFPGKAVPLQYTTTSPRLHALLKVG